MSKERLGEGYFISPSELKPKGLVGRVMWDIAFCDSLACGSKEAYMELLEFTAEEIIERVRNEH